MTTSTTSSGAELGCPYCGVIHSTPGVCPAVKAFEYFPNGTVKRVEFKTAADYPTAISWGTEPSAPFQRKDRP